ncbi:MAG: hypothetical protein KDC38_18355 [Planctomycetes bacterium]|nr:hypothetical protein [Planctomycetota bacterium]
MSNDRVFEIKCGCCGATIHVDPRTRSVYFTEKPGEKSSFEQRVEKAKEGVARKSQEAFEENLQKSTDKDALEKLFREAKKKAEADPNERPPSIWDYE